jgi:hypothetical protein
MSIRSTGYQPAMKKIPKKVPIYVSTVLLPAKKKANGCLVLVAGLFGLILLVGIIASIFGSSKSNPPAATNVPGPVIQRTADESKREFEASMPKVNIQSAPITAASSTSNKIDTVHSGFFASGDKELLIRALKSTDDRDRLILAGYVFITRSDIEVDIVGGDLWDGIVRVCPKGTTDEFWVQSVALTR